MSDFRVFFLKKFNSLVFMQKPVPMIKCGNGIITLYRCFSSLEIEKLAMIKLART